MEKMTAQDVLKASKETLQKCIDQQTDKYEQTMFKKAIAGMAEKFLHFFDTYLEYDRMFLKRDINFLETNVKQSFAIHKFVELEEFMNQFTEIADEAIKLANDN